MAVAVERHFESDAMSKMVFSVELAVAIGVLEDDAPAVADDEDGAGESVLGDALIDERGDRSEVGSEGCRRTLSGWLAMRGLLGYARDWQAETQEEQGSYGGGAFGACALAEEKAGERADDECRSRADEDVPGPGDVRDGDGAKMHGESSLPNPEIENEAADHANDGAELCSEARERAEQEDSEQAAVCN
jgi:hypothetical protein